MPEWRAQRHSEEVHRIRIEHLQRLQRISQANRRHAKAAVVVAMLRDTIEHLDDAYLVPATAQRPGKVNNVPVSLEYGLWRCEVGVERRAEQAQFHRRLPRESAARYGRVWTNR